MPKSALRLFVHSISHFIVDFACFFALFSYISESLDSAVILLLYNVLAFGLQPIFGTIADSMDDVRPFTLIGFALVAWGVMFSASIWVCVVLIGVGNAIFHVSGAVGCMRHRPSDPAYAGVYVAPGALGVIFGTIAGNSASMSVFGVAFIILIAMILVWAVGTGAKRGHITNSYTGKRPAPLGAFAVMLCLISIAFRSLMGECIRTDSLVISLVPAFAIFAGKFLGGFIARKLNWGLLGGICTALSGVLFAFAPTDIHWIGLVLLNIAMPLTLAGVMGSMPKNCGLGFGLTTLFLLFGSLPAVFHGVIGSISPIMIFAFALFSALMLVITLTRSHVNQSAHMPDGDESPTVLSDLASTLTLPCDNHDAVSTEADTTIFPSDNKKDAESFPDNLTDNSGAPAEKPITEDTNDELS